MTRFVKTALSRHIVFNAFKIAMVVGTLLNTLNQGESMLRGGTISWLPFILNFLVPYCVSSYSATKIELELELELRQSNDYKSGN